MLTEAAANQRVFRRLGAQPTAWTLAVILLASSFIFLWPTWKALHGWWLESTRYSHGHLVLLISAYLVYRLRPALAATAIRPQLLALVPLAGLLFTWLVAVLGSIQAIHEIVLPPILWVACLAVLGWPAAKHLVLPIAYLYLAIPVWESGNFVLQWATVWANEMILPVFGVSAFIEENSVHLPMGSFSIDGGCSGLHYLIIAVAISVLYGALYLQSMRRRLLLVGVAVALGLLTNWVRVFIVIYAGYLTDMQHYLVVHNHYYFGWVLFMLAMIPFMLFARRLEAKPAVDRQSPASRRQAVTDRWTSANTAAVAACLSLLAAASMVALARMPAVEASALRLSLPAAQGEWSVASEEDPVWRPYYPGNDAEAIRAYSDGRGIVTLYANLYRGQAQGKEVVGYENHIEGAGVWVHHEQGYRTVETASGSKWRLREAVLTFPGGADRKLYYWYYVHDRQLAQPLLTKLYYGLAAISDRPETGVQVISAVCGTDCDQARNRLEKWLAAYVPDGPIRRFHVEEGANL